MEVRKSYAQKSWKVVKKAGNFEIQVNLSLSSSVLSIHVDENLFHSKYTIPKWSQVLDT